MPESLLWLLSVNKTEEAEKLIKRITKINKQEEQFTSISFQKNENSVNDGTKSPVDDYQSKPESGLRTMTYILFSSKVLRKRIIILMYTWIVVNCCYYGLTVVTSQMYGNFYINYCALIFIEIPGFILAGFSVKWLGRKGTMVSFALVTGVTCILSGIYHLTSLQDHHLSILVLIITGKMCAATSFATLLVYSAELFPTNLRAFGLGFCSMASGIGTILMPFVCDTAKSYKFLPLFVFGGMSLISGFGTIFLPETLRTKLPQTVEESEAFGRNQSPLYFSCFDLCKKKKGTTDIEDSLHDIQSTII